MATQTQQEAVQREGGLLLHTIRAVLNREASPQDLEPVLRSSRQGLQQQLEDFEGILEDLDEDMRERVSSLTGAAREVFGFLETALGDCERFLQTPDENLLYGAGSLIRRGVDQLNYIFTELRNFVLAVQGPTAIPNLNLMLKAYEVYQPDQDAQGTRLRDLVQIERLNALAALDQLEVAEPTPELKYLKEVWDSHLRCMNRLFNALEKSERSLVTKEIENAKTTFSRLFERIPSATLSQRYEGPTPSPQVNLVLSLAQDVVAQNSHDAPLLEALAVVQQGCQGLIQGLEQLLEAGIDSVLLREAVEQALQSLDDQQDALQDFADFFTTRSDRVLRSAAANLEEASIGLAQSLDTLAELAEREGKVMCVRCGHANPCERGTCERCNAPLPMMSSSQGNSTFDTREGSPSGSASAQGPVLTSNMLRLYSAVNGMADGSLAAEAYLAELDWFQRLLESHAEFESLEEDSLSEEEIAHKEQLQEAFAAGLTEMLDALELLRGYCESEQRRDLEEGIRLMDQGARKLHGLSQG